MTQTALPARTEARGTLLDVVPATQRAELLRLGTLRHYEAGSVLLREGERSTHVLLFLSAVAKVTASLENGRMALLGIRVTGDIVGEMAAIDGGPRSATVTLCGAGVLRVIGRGEFVEFLRSCPDAHIAVSGMISRRLRWANRRRVDFNGYSSRIRLARVLVELAEAYGHSALDGITFDVGLTQEELGAFVGADTDTIGKEVRKLRSQEVIRTGYGSIMICDLTALKNIARMPDQ
ncbi:Crp/Fnr family transcriptional regulator [Actinoallomurus sp. NBC_01490]|jgi:CRP-like cAMP-binding protein|uniref:Crp/Fnr family transcriptional regulator n=1 Tax=Actinoallomurus sp. NBC_01490 TaxID=2903557 RepID=UPI002E352535|nr:Crp/Fnr family transcriptional regulator [Actinoallomurus sp. NBC_01490]